MAPRGAAGPKPAQTLLLVLLPLLCGAGWRNTGPRLQLSHSDLRNSSAVFWGGGVSGGYEALLLDEDGGWLLVGGKDHVYLLCPDRLDLPTHTIHWPADREHVDRCRLAGKSLETDCANFVRLLQPVNQTHVYACGTGAFHPQCTYLTVGRGTQDPVFMMSHTESGRGKCPFSPREPFTALLTGGALYAGSSVDFMGANPALLRAPVSSRQPHIQTEAYDHNWLHDPVFVASFSIPDTHSPDDDKVYFFFRERWSESGEEDQRVHSRVARVCKNDVGGKRSLINRWTTFLKARLVCSVPGPSGVDTHFDELEDVFVLETKDPQNPMVYGVFSTSSSLFPGSAVCVYSMSSLRSVFNGPFSHKEGGAGHRWVEFKGRIPYPRPGTCPSETYAPLRSSTQDFPDEVVRFMRQHQLMWDPVRPAGGRPVLTRVNQLHLLKRVVVDRVEAEDGPYHVLHLGTDDGKVLKVVSVVRGSRVEELVLEELTVFQSPTPILSMKLSTKRQLLVSSAVGLVQLGLQRCERYGDDCPQCRLARDPYCSWDGHTCCRYFPSSSRRARRQDVKHGDPRSQCPITEDNSASVAVQAVYGVEGNATFLECTARSPQAELRWMARRPESAEPGELRQGDGARRLHMKRGLLVQRLQPADSGLYSCSSQERSYSRVLARYRLHVIPAHSLQQRAPGTGLPGQSAGHGNSWAPQQHLKGYKDLQLGPGGRSQDQNPDCRQLWHREKRRQQKLKQESRKARVRRTPPETL
ncbi:semaphorin-3D isoform X2 [Pseudoliparis swirei]|uniref:semaphorin-3D isoform X2 n=1 Tax=Pseudoliparis swirei TaxID=2059687 RepID=UPI0024BDE6C0|nr:semaphorin-3D isoform X2 [Pseudoliparis swirei]